MSTSEVTDSAKPVGAHSTESPDSPFGSKILVTKCPGHSAEQILFSVRVREIDLFPPLGKGGSELGEKKICFHWINFSFQVPREGQPELWPTRTMAPSGLPSFSSP